MIAGQVETCQVCQKEKEALVTRGPSPYVVNLSLPQFLDAGTQQYSM